MSQDRYIAIDEEGYWIFSGRRVDDEGLGRTLLENLSRSETGAYVTNYEGSPAFVEYFDAPLIARFVRLGTEAGYGEFDAPYGFKARFALKSLCLDEWDRFHGETDKGIPFVFSRHAQVEFFEMLEEFDDDSITVKGERYAVPPWLQPAGEVSADRFWTDVYRAENKPGWDLGKEAPALPMVLPQLKLNRARVLVLGAGAGHDAAYLAKQGHLVTAVDFSDEALARARDRYAGLESLQLLRADAFKLPEGLTGRFDMIFEHTCYCAVSPDRRTELVKQWRRLLAPGGHLLGVFFALEKRTGPPWGGSEWEIRERLKSGFEFMYWTRWRESIEKRRGTELVVYARKK